MPEAPKSKKIENKKIEFLFKQISSYQLRLTT
jgi:hypothetical protein